jgi:hypothetical protein
MRLVTLLLAAAFCASPAALAAVTNDAADARLRIAFGNTILDTFPDGRTSEAWLEPDGAYTAEGRTHTKSYGRWFVAGPKLCFKQLHPFAFGYVYCTPIPNVGLGETWRAKSPMGEAVTVKVIPGHFEPRPTEASPR